MSPRRLKEPSHSKADHAMPTVSEALDAAARILDVRSADDAPREARFLLAGLLGTSPGRLALEGDRSLSSDEWAEYQNRLGRRAAGEPLQYIEGRAAFRQLSLRVDPSVLIPRPETEVLVEHVLAWCRGRRELLGLDLGTGSGAIAISLLREGPFRAVVAVDISGAALNLARVNASETRVAKSLDLRQGSLFGALRPGERFHVIVSNPPYIADGEAGSLPEEVREWEPSVALFAGPTGMEVISAIVGTAPRHLEPGGLLALEVAPTVADAALRCVRESRFYEEPRLANDLAGLPRVLTAELAGER